MKAAVYKLRSEASPETNPDGNLIWILASKLWENKFLLSVSSSLWYFIMEAWDDDKSIMCMCWDIHRYIWLQRLDLLVSLNLYNNPD